MANGESRSIDACYAKNALYVMHDLNGRLAIEDDDSVLCRQDVEAFDKTRPGFPGLNGQSPKSGTCH
jgi:hypothetical protein